MGKTYRRNKTDDFQKIKKQRKDNIREERRNKERVKDLYTESKTPNNFRGQESRHESEDNG